MQTFNDELKQLIKDSVNLDALMVSLGFKIYRSTRDEIRAPCIIHGGDNPTGFSMRRESKKWHCFTKKCEIGSSGKSENDVFSLVMRVKNVGFIESVRFICDLSGVKFEPDKAFVEIGPQLKLRKDMDRFVKSVGKSIPHSEVPQTISEETIKDYISCRDEYFIKEGFLPETLESFEVGAKIDRYGELRATIPIRDENGRAVSVSARREEGNAEPRYLLDCDFQKSRILYNLHKALETKSETVIIVEGFKAAWAVHEAGYPNVIACMGAVMTDEQVMLLCRFGFRNCLVMFDGDEAGQIGMEKTKKKISKYFKFIGAYLPENVSPDDLSRQELKEFLEMYMDCF